VQLPLQRLEVEAPHVTQCWHLLAQAAVVVHVSGSKQWQLELMHMHGSSSSDVSASVYTQRSALLQRCSLRAHCYAKYNHQ
jgi:hypothetical protein